MGALREPLVGAATSVSPSPFEQRIRPAIERVFVRAPSAPVELVLLRHEPPVTPAIPPSLVAARMSRRTQPAGQLGRYGLPKNVVVTDAPDGTPPSARVWLVARDEFDGMLFDALDALNAGVIGRRTFDVEKARLMVARRKADSRFEQAVRRALRPVSHTRLRRVP